MKERLLFLLKVVLSLLLVFVVCKLVFILVNAGEDKPSMADITSTCRHGLSLDLTISLYIVTIPTLVTIVSIWWNKWQWMRNLLKGYFALISIPLVVGMLADMVLYHFWGIKLEASVMQFLDTTGAAFTSISWLSLLLLLIVGIVACWAIAWLLIRCTPKTMPSLAGSKKIIMTFLMLLLLPLMVIGIRGGIGESTANVGQVYFSQNQFLNHAAVNPVFSFLSSFSSTHRLPEHYFFDSKTCHEMTDSLFFTDSKGTDMLLTTKTPNIVMVIMEGCGGTFTLLNDKADVTPNLTRLVQEGVFFSNCYANSWRTDRGNVSILSGYPAFPNSSVMKISSKCGKLPSIARTLGKKGYYARYIYGGDINFTNTKGYLIGTGFNETISDKDFSLADQQSSSWGVCDEKVFDRAIQVIGDDHKKGTQSMNVIMTLSSHEPWDVPMQRKFDDEELNAFYYLDKCIGEFVDKLKAHQLWDNTLLIILPDHGSRYQSYGYESRITCHIPLIWTGGAVKIQKDIDVLCNQSDLAATLLGQMGIPHEEFLFSRDVLSSSYRYPFATYSYTNHIALIDSTNQYHLYDLQDNRIEEDAYFRLSKALLQRACEDLRDR